MKGIEEKKAVTRSLAMLFFLSQGGTLTLPIKYTQRGAGEMAIFYQSTIFNPEGTQERDLGAFVCAGQPLGIFCFGGTNQELARRTQIGPSKEWPINRQPTNQGKEKGNEKSISSIIYTACVIAFFIVVIPESLAGNLPALKNRLAYLNDIPEVSSVKFVGNQVYIGFNRMPLFDIAGIVGGAAAFGSSAYGSRISVWACEFDRYESDPTKWRAYCYAIARGGKARINRCPAW